jgi:diguanylate cyclase (GGDEF)-like protein
MPMDTDARGTWLCPTLFDRERLVDMEERIAPARALMFGSLGLGMLAGVPWFGWTILPAMAWVVVFYRLLQPWIERSPRPEYPIAVSVVHAQVVLGVAVALTGGPQSPALPMLLLGVVTLPARFTSRGVVAGVILTAIVMVVSTVPVDPAGFADDPTLVVACLACLAGLAAVSNALMRSEIHQRARAVLDPLTGLLNREALTDRFEELAEQAALNDESVALIACDLDNFKAINDEYGHDRGDAVLKEAAYAMRRDLRSFELIYRMGGEEFLIVLPGADLTHGERLAERVRSVLAAERPGGLHVTASMGVAAAEGADVDFGPLFQRADRALYLAKNEGRNRVVALGPGGRSSPPELPGWQTTTAAPTGSQSTSSIA